MLPNRSATRVVVFISLALAMLFRIIPLPKTLFVFNPDWVLLFLIYWAMAIPERVGVGYAWCAGLFVDVLTGRMMGQHALAYSLIAYLCVKFHRLLRLYPMPQQTFMVLLMLALAQLLIFWTQSIKVSSGVSLNYWLPSLSGALIWPLVFVLLRRLRRRYDIF